MYPLLHCPWPLPATADTSAGARARCVRSSIPTNSSTATLSPTLSLEYRRGDTTRTVAGSTFASDARDRGLSEELQPYCCNGNICLDRGRSTVPRYRISQLDHIHMTVTALADRTDETARVVIVRDLEPALLLRWISLVTSSLRTGQYRHATVTDNKSNFSDLVSISHRRSRLE